MGILDSIKNRMHKKSDDLDDLRSGVLNEPDTFNAETFRQPLRPEQFSDERFRQEPLRPEPMDQRRYNDYFPQRDTSMETMSLEPTRASTESRSDNSYEVLDRLRFIENQLAAIRSQTELINERLKNLEVRIGRPRY